MSILRLFLGALAATVVFYAGQLAALIIRFGEPPNYLTWHDWPQNVARIWRGTPSLWDIPAIVADEWLLEIGCFSTDYGNGVAVWSLTLLPVQVVKIMAAGGLLTAATLKLRAAPAGARRTVGTAAAAVGGGLTALTGVTVYWVACCAAPSWVVGLAVMGMSVGAAFALLPWGPWLTAAGFALLAAAVLAPNLAVRRTGR